MLSLRKLSLPLAVAALSALGTVFSTSAQAQTTNVPVVNPGFEFPAIAANTTTGNTPYGYTFNGGFTDGSGTYQTGLQSASITGRTGNQYGFIYNGGQTLEQNTNFTTTVGDTYTLFVDVNTDAGTAGISLTNGLFGVNKVTFSSVTGISSNAAFTTYSTSFVAATASNLGFVLTKVNGTQENFDNIQVTQFAPASAPEPAAWVGLVVGAMGLGALSLRARRRSLPA